MKMRLVMYICAALAAGSTVNTNYAEDMDGKEVGGVFASPIISRSISYYHYQVQRFRYGMEVKTDRFFGTYDRKTISAEFECDLVIDFSELSEKNVTTGEDGEVEIVFEPKPRNLRMDSTTRMTSGENTIQTKIFGWLYSSKEEEEDWENLEERARNFVEELCRRQPLVPALSPGILLPPPEIKEI